MPEDARVYTVLSSFLLRTTGLAAGAYILLIVGSRVSRSINPTSITISFALAVVLFVYLRLAKVPRLEVARSGIRYIGLGYKLYTLWSDVERLETWQAGWAIHGLVSRNLSLEIVWWAKPLYPLGGLVPRLNRFASAPITTGIPLEPEFSRDVFALDDELGDELRQYVPRIFEPAQDEAAA